MNPLRLGMGLTTLLLTASCAWLPESSKRAEAISMPTFNVTLNNANKSVKIITNWPNQNWWQDFKSPELNRLVTTALSDSPDFKRAAARLRQSQAMVDAQAAELYPTIDANVSFSAQRFSANSVQAKLAGEHFRHLLINPLVLRYHLDLWGQDKTALAGAIGKAQAAETELADVRLLLATAVSKAYFDLASLIDKLKITEQLIDCRMQLLHLSEVRFRIGLTSTASLFSDQTAVKTVEEQHASLHYEIEVRKNLLAILAGKGPDWGRTIRVETLAKPALYLPKDLPLHLLAHRPDIQAARLRMEAAAQAIKVAKTAFYPDINLVAFTGLHSVSLSDVLLQGSSLAYAVGPSIDFPIFEGGRLRAQLGYQEAAYDEAVENYNTYVLRAVQEVVDALARWQDVATRIEQHQELLGTVKESRRIAEVLYRQGINDKNESLLASAEEQVQMLKMADLQREFFTSVAQLYNALGGGYLDISNKH